MNWYNNAPIWHEQGFAPNTQKNAIPCDPKLVRNKRVIHVVDASFRSATFSGHFLIADGVNLPLPQSGIHLVDVYCRWFDHRLRFDNLFSFKVNMDTTTISTHYSGPVFTNFKKPNTR